MVPTLTPCPAPPLPPPPPPPGGVTNTVGIPQIKETSESEPKKGISHENVTSTPEEQARKACKWFLKDNGLTQDEVGDYVFISNYRPVKPIIQNGPLCGMVALAMASELSGDNVSTEEIFDEAKKCHFSLKGEMFSASFMKDLTSKFIGCDVELVGLKPNEQFNYLEPSAVIIKALLQDALILFPYDADKNHGPCQARGHKAHWALITGFFTVIKKQDLQNSLLEHLREDGETKGLQYWDGSSNFDNDEFVNFLSKYAEFKVYSHQGKSKYCGLWHLKNMLESNNNLLEVGSDRAPEEYLIPAGGVEEGLRCKAVLIYPRRR